MIGEVQWRVRPPSYVDVVKGWKEQEPDNMGGGVMTRGTPAVFQLFCTQGQRCSWLRKELSTHRLQLLPLLCSWVRAPQLYPLLTDVFCLA